MRIVGEVPHPDCKITLYNWNNRYLVKIEKGFLEQTYKINQFELASDQALLGVVNEEFIREALALFQAMTAAWQKAVSQP